MDQIEEVLSKVDIVELINSYVPLKKAGRNFKACCPFHSEKTPSFIVSPELQIFKCFGCGAGGSAIKFLQEYEKMDFREALRFLADKVGIKLQDYRPDKQELIKDKLLAINHLASEYYHFILTKHPAGKQGLVYLRSRGISNQSIKVFKLGFAPAGWENLVNFLVKKKGYKTEEIIQTGLVVGRYQTSDGRSEKFKAGGRRPAAAGYYDRFRERIIFPIFDHRGNVIGFSGRVLDGGNELSKGAKYINTPETLLYHKSRSLYGLLQAKEAIKKEDSVILVEGEFDVISSYQVGVKNVAAIKGSALTKEQVELLSRFTKNFSFCLDEDIAGQSAIKRGIEIAEEFDINIRVISLVSGKDADEAARIDPAAFRLAVKRTIPIYDFYLQSAIKRFGVDSAEAKKKISQEVLPLFNKIVNEVVKDHYLKKLAERLEISQEAVIREAQRQKKSQSFLNLTKSPVKKALKSRREILEEYLLSLALQTKNNLSDLLKGQPLKYLSDPAVKRIFKYLNKYSASRFSKFKIEEFVKILPEELKETVSRLYLTEIFSEEGKSDKIKKEWQRTNLEIEKLYLHDKLGELRKVLGDKSRSKEERRAAEKEIVKISQKIFQDEKEKN
jgi:DNA primase